MSSQEIGQLKVVLEAQTAEFTRGMDAAIKQIQKMEGAVANNGRAMNQVSAQFKSAADAVGLIGRAFAVLGGLGYMKSLFDAADAAADLGDAFGIATSEVYAYQDALLAAGGKAEGVDKSFQKLSQNITEAFEGSDAARKSFNDLGITLESIRSANVGEVFDVVAKALARIEDPAKRNAMAMELLGKSAIGIDWRKFSGEIDGAKDAYKKLEPSILAAAEASERFELTVKRVSAGLTALGGDIIGGGLFEKLKKGFSDLIDIVKGKLSFQDALLFEEMEKLDKQLQSATKNASALNREVSALKSDPFQNWVESLKKAQVEAGLFTQKMAYLDAQMAKAVTAEQIKLIQSEIEKLKGKNPFEEWKDSVDKSIQSYSMLIDQLQYLAELRNTDFITLEEYNKEIAKLGYGTKAATDEFTKLGEEITDAIGANANNAVNTFIDSIGNAKLSFSDFASSVLKDIAKVIFQLMIMKPLIDGVKMMLAPATGGATLFASAPSTVSSESSTSRDATGAMQGFSLGATRMSMNLASLGRSMDSFASMPALTAKVPSRSIAYSPTMNVTVNNNASEVVEVKPAEVTNSDGSKSLEIFVERIIKDRFSTGTMDKTMKSSFGLTRVGV